MKAAPTPNDDTAAGDGEPTSASVDGINSSSGPPSATATDGKSRSATLGSIAEASNQHSSSIPGLSELLGPKSDTRTKAAKPCLPSMAKLLATVSNKINETPPYLALSSISSSAQKMNIEDPKIVDAEDNKYPRAVNSSQEALRSAIACAVPRTAFRQAASFMKSSSSVYAMTMRLLPNVVRSGSWIIW